MNTFFSKILSSATLLLFLCITSISIAQPGGHPGGRFPMGAPPAGHPGGSSNMSMSDRERMRKEFEQRRAQEKAMELRQQKKVREGDLFKVVGTLQDSTNGEAIPYVNIAILDATDSTMVKGGITDLNGYFEVQNIPQGDMLLRVSAIGYKNIMVPFTVTNNTALGIIKIAPGATQLKEVKITASRPLYAMDGEKMVYNVADDPTIQTGTTSDALQNAPGVEVDIEGNITLRGVSSVEIWVNDKPSKLTAENLKTYLETLPANALDRIETITNPSAKYATSAEAVINIITSAYIKSNHFISFGVNGATQPFVSPWLSYTWANEKLSINIYSSGRYNYSESTGWSNTTYRRDGTETGTFDTTATESKENTTDNRRFNGNIFANVSYEIDSMTNIEFMGNYNYSYSINNHNLSRTYNYLMNDIFYDYVDTNRTGSNSGFGMAGVDFTHKFNNRGHNIRASIHNNFNSGRSQQDFIRLFNPATSTLGEYTNYDKCYADNNRTNNLSADIRYNLPYSDDGEFSFGFGYGNKLISRDYDVSDDASTDAPTRDLLRSYHFNDNENSAEADIEWTRRWGGFTLELGFGSQYEHIDFAYKGSEAYPFTNDDTTYNFITFNPSIHLSYRTQSMHNFKLNYSLRMRHAGEEQLTTYKRYTLDSWSTGNRNLQYAYTHNAEVGWNKFFMSFGSIGLEGYARYSANEIDNLTTSTEEADPILDRIVQFSVPYNMGSSYRIGGTAFVTYRPNGFFNLRLYTNIYDYGYSFLQPGKDEFSDHRVSWSTRLNCWVKLWNKYQVFASANYSSPTISLAAQRSARYYLNCGVRADFFKRKLSAFVNVQDIFNWGKTIGNGSSNTNPYLLSESNSYTLNSRYISAGVTLRFGKMELENRSKSGGDSPSAE
ncbi:MAG: TonB-dependent receptor family protein [Bacteroidales bacterium]|nr:TonB-dependent receptor family protein [Bacteroidales bacterium]